MGYAHFTGSMMLSFASIESYSASTAFSMSRHSNFSSFDYDKYKRTRAFRDKLNQIFQAVGQPIDWSQGLFLKIKEMQHWRNLVAHSSPTAFDSDEGTDASNTKTYLDRVELEHAKSFYDTSVKYIEQLEKLTGIKPTTHVTFKVEAQEQNTNGTEN